MIKLTVIFCAALVFGGCATQETRTALAEVHIAPFLRSTCRLHHAKRLPDRVPVAYGLFDRSYVLLEETYFPNAYTSVRGGCVVLEEKAIDVVYCPVCRGAENQWRAADKKKDSGRLTSFFFSEQIRNRDPLQIPRRTF